MLAFPKPKDFKLPAPVAVVVFPDGREVCQLVWKPGRVEYKRRIEFMADRQAQICCLYGHIEICPGSLIGWVPTFEHEDGRGMNGAWRDDRIEKDGKPYNGAAHSQCNNAKGSRFIDYNHNREVK